MRASSHFSFPIGYFNIIQKACAFGSVSFFFAFSHFPFTLIAHFHFACDLMTHNYWKNAISNIKLRKWKLQMLHRIVARSRFEQSCWCENRILCIGTSIHCIGSFRCLFDTEHYSHSVQSVCFFKIPRKKALFKWRKETRKHSFHTKCCCFYLQMCVVKVWWWGALTSKECVQIKDITLHSFNRMMFANKLYFHFNSDFDLV